MNKILFASIVMVVLLVTIAGDNEAPKAKGYVTATLRAAESEILINQAIKITLSLANRSDQPVPIDKLRDPQHQLRYSVYQVFNAQVQKIGEPYKVPGNFGGFGGIKLNLGIGKALTDDLVISLDYHDWANPIPIFGKEGSYYMFCVIRAENGTEWVSNEVEIKVRLPETETEKETVRLLEMPDVMRYLFFPRYILSGENWEETVITVEKIYNLSTPPFRNYARDALNAWKKMEAISINSNGQAYRGRGLNKLNLQDKVFE
ncbi:hypothetical protein HY772_04550 [Candidatus Woesearchaeota archaeon]|nr:hypothetical protein [Candidatus Woesearchaeota archaeon]